VFIFYFLSEPKVLSEAAAPSAFIADDAAFSLFFFDYCATFTFAM
jgi:hypothetical protein